MVRMKCQSWRHRIAIACVGVAVPAIAPAQTANVAPGAGHRSESTIIGGQPKASAVERCVDVRIGDESAFGCINQQLRREVDRVNPSLNLPPIDARSPDVRVGNVNEAGVRQQYGSNYGRSVVPSRPSVPAYALPRR